MAELVVDNLKELFLGSNSGYNDIKFFYAEIIDEKKQDLTIKKLKFVDCIIQEENITMIKIIFQIL